MHIVSLKEQSLLIVAFDLHDNKKFKHIKVHTSSENFLVQEFIILHNPMHLFTLSSPAKRPSN
jgi:hypothetical protein